MYIVLVVNHKYLTKRNFVTTRIHSNKMIQIKSTTEFMPGTKRRRIYLFEDNEEDVIMTDGPVYESEEEVLEREDKEWEELVKLTEAYDDT